MSGILKRLTLNPLIFFAVIYGVPRKDVEQPDPPSPVGAEP
jgi:hypothetical protein